MAKEFSVSGPSGRNPVKGTKSPGNGFLYIAVIMFIAITAGTFLSGGSIPLDPNGPGGPPTLPPYFGANGQDIQAIEFPSTTVDPHNNLQLKTFSVNVCGSTDVIDFLIDTSESMKFDDKMTKVKSGLTAFVSALSPSSVVGIQTFSATVDNRVRLDYLRNNRASVVSNIQNLNAEGWTRMRDGFQMAKSELSDAVTGNKFPGYKYFLVILSDGVPETPPPRTCKTPPGPVTEPLEGSDGRCFTTEQDPRVPTNIADDIKGSVMNVEVYAVGLFGPTMVSDATMKPYLDELLGNVVSSPASTHYYSTNTNAVNLVEVLKGLATSICGGYIGGGASTAPQNYPFPTFPSRDINVTVAAPGGSFQQ